ncbi:hypothetical protein OPW33_24255 [Vibrio europaeus]|uniref:hypothetical protein n=1 Tax=Vibrio europaeus TaxID=300876 RepID=UPI0023412A39|nr:hypothetical protein [Vibrio europaeus]MDC5840185.1 hypothetical protein [Vibrio europaeus]MDC5840204.1 hypothetical protein [Vibrio europaeus]MDC5842443.1 hypothetical protein [Vibrio europaeus]
MTVSPQLEKRLIDLGFVILGGVAVWYVTRNLGKSIGESVGKVDNFFEKVTKQDAELISFLTAKYNGWSAVELQPLMIRDFYLNPDFTLTANAKDTLWNIEQYRPLMVEIFGTPDGAMSEKYRPLINKPIE